MVVRCGALLFALVCLSCLWQELARADDDYFRKGAYVGAGAVVGIDNFRGRTGGASVAPGAELRAGYRLTSIFSAEVLGEFMDDFAYGSTGPWQQVRMWHVSGNIKGSVNMRRLSEGLGRVQPYAVLGVGYYQAWLHDSFNPAVVNKSVRDGMARIGVGVDVYLTNHILVSLEGRYNALFNRQAALDYWSIGLGPQLRF